MKMTYSTSQIWCSSFFMTFYLRQGDEVYALFCFSRNTCAKFLKSELMRKKGHRPESEWFVFCTDAKKFRTDLNNIRLFWPRVLHLLLTHQLFVLLFFFLPMLLLSFGFVNMVRGFFFILWKTSGAAPVTVLPCVTLQNILFLAFLLFLVSPWHSLSFLWCWVLNYTDRRRWSEGEVLLNSEMMLNIYRALH